MAGSCRSTDIKDIVTVRVCIICTAFVRCMVRVRVDECCKIVGEVDGTTWCCRLMMRMSLSSAWKFTK